jgi:hypothetical protein
MSGTKRNAFDCFLLGGSSRSAKRKKGFVACPCCGSSVFEELINSHLDACVQPAGDKQEVRTDLSSPAAWSSRQTSAMAAAQSVAETTKNKTGDGTSNVFAHMMKQSKKLHQSSSQHFHLNADYTLTWSDTAQAPENATAWSATIQLRRNETKIQLTLSTSIPEQPSPFRLVKGHSRLSIPVLKSILQKSVRRRRPLPTIRVAMEIVDKALGELLRRLPIIILEDSTLHPDLPLLCWLMAAESKGYRVPLELISKVLQIIYEVSSCPWTDYLDDDGEDDKGKPGDDDNLPKESVENLLLRTIDMRNSYGGMKGDMQMLRGYQKTWGKRFGNSTPLSPEMSKRLGASEHQGWNHVPDLICMKSRNLGIQNVTSLMKNRLAWLELKDLCVEGVDFHCSDVLGQLMNDESFVVDSTARLQRDGLLQQAEGDRKAELLAILKRCMWKYSSGVNFRQPLMQVRDKKVAKDGDDPLKSFWRDMAAERAKAFMIQYIKSRMING